MNQDRLQEIEDKWRPYDRGGKDVLWLIARVKELESIAKQLCDACEGYRAEITRLEAENERLRAQIVQSDQTFDGESQPLCGICGKEMAEHEGVVCCSRCIRMAQDLKAENEKLACDRTDYWNERCRLKKENARLREALKSRDRIIDDYEEGERVRRETR